MTTRMGGDAGGRLLDRAYFLDLLGDSHNGLGRYHAAIDAYEAAAIGFSAQGADCSFALCLFKIAESYLSLDQPRHARRYLAECLPLLHDLGMTRHEALAAAHLATCPVAEANLAAQS
jgi:tetratricopeptide (TPR) repeat protein